MIVAFFNVRLNTDVLSLKGFKKSFTGSSFVVNTHHMALGRTIMQSTKQSFSEQKEAFSSFEHRGLKQF